MEVSKININGTEYALRDDSKLPQPEAAEAGQLIQIVSVDENGRVVKTVGMDPAATAVFTANWGAVDSLDSLECSMTPEKIRERILAGKSVSYQIAVEGRQFTSGLMAYYEYSDGTYDLYAGVIRYSSALGAWQTDTSPQNINPEVGLSVLTSQVSDLNESVQGHSNWIQTFEESGMSQIDGSIEAMGEELEQKMVKTVNGTTPDENGNVAVTSTCELTQPVWGYNGDTDTYKAIPGEYVEGASRILLWENASLRSSFAAQDISLSNLTAPEVSGAFSHIEVEFGVYYSRYTQDGDVRTVVRIPYGLDLSSKLEIVGRAFAPCYFLGPVTFSRDFSPYEGNIFFAPCYKITGTASSTDNTAMVPYKIYGIK